MFKAQKTCDGKERLLEKLKWQLIISNKLKLEKEGRR
jgi:hypothetical protein